MTSEVGAYMAGGIVIAIVGDIIIVGCWAVVSKESNTLQKKVLCFFVKKASTDPVCYWSNRKWWLKKKR